MSPGDTVRHKALDLTGTVVSVSRPKGYGQIVTVRLANHRLVSWMDDQIEVVEPATYGGLFGERER